MIIQEALRAALATNANILSHVSTRVYWGERPQNSGLPAITLMELGGGESYQDMTAGSVGLAVLPVQVDCLAATPSEALAIREHVRLILQNHINAVMGGVGGVQVWACIFSGKSQGYEPETGTYIASVDFDVHHEEALS